jgi:1,4-alpha-glucan branching enzyme
MKQVHLGIKTHKGFVEFVLWFPRAKSVTLVLDNEDFRSHDFPLTLDEGSTDIWRARVKEAKIGMTYQFRVEQEDGKVVLMNDPRARQLSSSSNGKGVIADTVFDWGDDDKFIAPPRNEQVIYELHVGTFNQPDKATRGTFATVAEQFDILKRLGVNMLELMPVTSMLDGEGWGYAPVGLYSVEERYGGPHGLRQFIKAAHSHGFGVIIDIVYNHIHQSTDLPSAYFFEGDLYHTPWGPRFDYTKPEVRQYIEDSVAMWFNDFHADGLRVDFTLGMRQIDMTQDDIEHEIPNSWELLQNMNRAAHHSNPNALMIAEDNGKNEWLTKRIHEGGAGFDAQWGVELPRAIDEAFGTANTPSSFGALVHELHRYFNGHALQKITFVESHDTAAIANGNQRLARDFDPRNAAPGKASAMTMLASVIALTAPGAPMLFQGQVTVVNNGWSIYDPIDWPRVERFTNMITAHEHIIDLRKNIFGDSAGLTSNDFQLLLTDEPSKLLIYQRGLDEAQPVIVVAYFGVETLSDRQLPLPAGTWKVRFNSSWHGYYPDAVNPAEEMLLDTVSADDTLQLPPYVVLILTKV